MYVLFCVFFIAREKHATEKYKNNKHFSPFLEISNSTRFSKFWISGGKRCSSLSLRLSFRSLWSRKKFWNEHTKRDILTKVRDNSLLVRYRFSRARSRENGAGRGAVIYTKKNVIFDICCATSRVSRLRRFHAEEGREREEKKSFANTRNSNINITAHLR